MSYRTDILAQIAEEVEDTYTYDEAEAEAREKISDAINEYERLLCKDEIKELVAPFTECTVEFDDENGIVHATEEDFETLDNTFEEDDEEYAVKEGKIYRFSALKERPSVLASKIYASQMDIASRYVTAGDVESLNFLTSDPAFIDSSVCPVCGSPFIEEYYRDEFETSYICTECGFVFSIDTALAPEIEIPVDVYDFEPDIEAHITFCNDFVDKPAEYSILVGGEEVSNGYSQGYQEALDHCKTWYNTYIGIEPGNIYSSSHTGSKMQITAKKEGSIKGINLNNNKSFKVGANHFVEQLLDNDFIEAGKHDVYMDTAEKGDQYQKEDGNIIEVMDKESGMIQFADSASGANMFNVEATKWLPTQEFYAMIDNKGYQAI